MTSFLQPALNTTSHGIVRDKCTYDYCSEISETLTENRTQTIKAVTILIFVRFSLNISDYRGQVIECLRQMFQS